MADIHLRECDVRRRVDVNDKARKCRRKPYYRAFLVYENYDLQNTADVSEAILSGGNRVGPESTVYRF